MTTDVSNERNLRNWYSAQGVLHFLVNEHCLTCGATHPAHSESLRRAG